MNMFHQAALMTGLVLGQVEPPAAPPAPAVPVDIDPAAAAAAAAAQPADQFGTFPPAPGIGVLAPADQFGGPGMNRAQYVSQDVIASANDMAQMMRQRAMMNDPKVSDQQRSSLQRSNEMLAQNLVQREAFRALMQRLEQFLFKNSKDIIQGWIQSAS